MIVGAPWGWPPRRDDLDTDTIGKNKPMRTPSSTDRFRISIEFDPVHPNLCDCVAWLI